MIEIQHLRQKLSSHPKPHKHFVVLNNRMGSPSTVDIDLDAVAAIYLLDILRYTADM